LELKKTDKKINLKIFTQ